MNKTSLATLITAAAFTVACADKPAQQAEAPKQKPKIEYVDQRTPQQRMIQQAAGEFGVSSSDIVLKQTHYTALTHPIPLVNYETGGWNEGDYWTGCLKGKEACVVFSSQGKALGAFEKREDGWYDAHSMEQNGKRAFQIYRTNPKIPWQLQIKKNEIYAVKRK